MYTLEQRQFAVDLWFEMYGTISLDDFVAELGWPTRPCLTNWIKKDPRYDPDRAQYNSKSLPTKLEIVRRLADGETYAAVAKDYGISRVSASKFYKMYAAGGASALIPQPTIRRAAMSKKPTVSNKPKQKAPFERPPKIPKNLPDDPEILKAIIGQLEMDNAILREVLDVLKADPGCDPNHLNSKEKAVIICNLENRFSVSALCSHLVIPRSTYYHALNALTKQTSTKRISKEVRDIFENEGMHVRGYRFIKAVLDKRLGHPTSEKIIRRCMREEGLGVIYTKKKRRYSSYKGEIDTAPINLLRTNTGKHIFSAAKPNEIWVSDITEFNLPDADKKVYLSAVIDLFDGKPVGWSTSTSPDAEFANASLLKACSTLKRQESPIIHTDRGCHYRWNVWKEICTNYALIRSMSRKGCSPDNAAMEGFFGRLKNEFFYGRDWRGVDQNSFMNMIDAWMNYYSKERLKAFRVAGKTIYDTIDGRRLRLGLTA